MIRVLGRAQRSFLWTRVLSTTQCAEDLYLAYYHAGIMPIYVEQSEMLVLEHNVRAVHPHVTQR
jgi:hypothetical protein